VIDDVYLYVIHQHVNFPNVEQLVAIIEAKFDIKATQSFWGEVLGKVENVLSERYCIL
jgi:hypothetical protein